MPTKTVDVRDTGAQLAELVSLVTEGTDVIITDGATPVARLVPLRASNGTNVTRIPGLHPGAIWTSDDFDEPLPDEFWLGDE